VTALSRVPEELRARRQWVVWRFERRDGRPTKVPYRVDIGSRAAVDDPRSWTTFEDASTFAREHADGTGFVFTTSDPFVGVDLDDCIVDGKLHPEAADIMRRLNTYSERSVSGTGAHAIGRAGLSGVDRNRTGKTPWGGEFEVYDKGRFFCMTGDWLPDTPEQATECQAGLTHVLGELLPVSNGGPPPEWRAAGRTDAEILERAFAAANGAKVERLYRGDPAGYGSRSEADLALCSALAFWTGPDPGQLDRLLRGSGLMRDKWERLDYREGTLTKALQRSDFFAWEKVTRGSESPESAPKPRGLAGVADSGVTLPMGVTRVSHDTPKSAVGDSADSESPESPFAQTLVDFIAERSESPMALIGDEHEVLLPAAGLMLLVAKGGKGKTTLVVELALHLASGVDWLGFTVSRPLRVLFIENEGPREPFRAKLEIKRGLWEHEIRGELFIHSLDWGAFSLADETAHAGLRAFIELQNIDVVIGDPLDSLGMTGVGSPEDVRGLMALMHRVGLHRNVAFLLLHHPHKGEASDPLDEASGAWGGKPDTQLNLEKRSGDRARLSFPKVRWSRRGARAAYLLGFDPDTESFSVVHEEDEEERDHDAEILELLTDGCWRTPKEVAAPAEKGGIGANVDLVKDRLAKRPDLFVSRTGEAAKALDRHPTATIWQLVDNEDQTQLAA
jgi:hypothetical protein